MLTTLGNTGNVKKGLWEGKKLDVICELELWKHLTRFFNLWRGHFSINHGTNLTTLKFQKKKKLMKWNGSGL